MITFYMCQITGKYFEDTLITKTAVRVADYPSESSWESIRHTTVPLYCSIVTWTMQKES